MSDPTIPSQDDSAYLAAIEEGLRNDLLAALDTCAELAAGLRSLNNQDARPVQRLLAALAITLGQTITTRAKRLHDALEGQA